jgi:hypothetical protein
MAKKGDTINAGTLLIPKEQAAQFLKDATRNRGRYQVSPRAERTHDGVVYHSKKEMLRHIALMIEQRAGYISELDRQVEYPLIVNGIYITKYIADHVYVDSFGSKVVEDTKGSKETTTEEFRIKKLLMKALHGIDVIEVY